MAWWHKVGGVLAVFSLTTGALAVETEVGGFIAVDLIQVTKADNARQDDRMGIGALDFKLNARQDNTSMRLKLDLDDSKIGEAYKIFEVALVTQSLTPDFSISAGKGTARFHRLHWGAISASYFDGGTILGNFDWTFVDVDNMLLVAAEYGGPKQGVSHTLSLFGDGEMEVKTNKDGTVKHNEDGTIAMAGTSKNFSPRRQRGVAYRVDMFLSRQAVVTLAYLNYWHQFNPQQNQAFDIGFQLNPTDWEIWGEALYGTSSSFVHHYDKRTETIAQLGAEYFVAPPWSIVADTEMAMFKYDDTNNPPEKQADGSYVTHYKAPKRIEGTMHKVELAGRYAFNKFTYLVTGVMWEDRALRNEPTVRAIRASSSLSHWF